MSESSYQDNVRRGVTGPETETCLQASHDRVSEVLGIHPATYEQYQAVRQAYVESCGDGSIYVPPEIIRACRAACIAYFRDLGVNTLRNVQGYNESTEVGLRNRLAKLSAGGFRIAVFLDTGGKHSVGVKQVEPDWYQAKSTSSPFDEKEPVSVSDIFDWLDLGPRLRKRAGSSKNTFKDANVLALPPEPN